MGVHDLWQVLEPVARKVHLEELKGQVIAVDLSGWIVESQRVQATHNTSKYMHLRNLFFRCAKLLGYGMDLVFVLEGDAPDVKGETLSQRKKLYCPEIRDSRRGGSRPRLKALSEQCQDLLSTMGLQCVQGSGEAEATCAALNKKNLVDACMTEDSDVFLYGATLVYRGIVIDDKDPHVLAYKMSDIESQLNLTREKLIAVALLAGCDYFPGVQGVGKETAIKLFTKLGNVSIIDRFKSWNTDSKFEELQNKMDVIMRKPRHCNVCHHPGSPKLHSEEGCENCKTEKQCKTLSDKDAQCKCRWHETDNIKREWKLELDVRRKAMANAQFPPEEVVEEFLRDQNDLRSLDGSWKQPKLNAFQEYMQKMLLWDPSESFEKLFPLCTRWHLLHMDQLCGALKPERIVKLRNIRNVPLYEVLWSQEEHEDPTQDSDVPQQTTLEPQELFKTCYPVLVDQFIEEINAKKATRKTAKSTKDIREFFKVKAKGQEQAQPDPVQGTGKRGSSDVDVKKVEDEECTVEQASSQQATEGRKLSQLLIGGQLEQAPKDRHTTGKLTCIRQPGQKKSVTRTQKTVPEPAVQITKFFGLSIKKDPSANDSLDEYTVPLAERIRRKAAQDDRDCADTTEKEAREIAGLSDLEISIPKSPTPEERSPTKTLRKDMLSAQECSPPKRKPTPPKHETKVQFTKVRSPNTSQNNQSAATEKSVRCLFPVQHETPTVKYAEPSSANIENCGSPCFSIVRASSFESTPIGAVTEKCHRNGQSLIASEYDPSKSLFTTFDEQSLPSRETHSVIVISDDEC